MQKLNVLNAKIYNCDAALFNDIDRYNYFYFFNPFPVIVMKEVINNIKKSLIRIPRNITIIYFNPTCHEEIINDGIFEFVKKQWNVSIYNN
jgi:hypothetical protein